MRHRGISEADVGALFLTIAIVSFTAFIVFGAFNTNSIAPTTIAQITYLNHPDNSPVWVVGINDRIWNITYGDDGDIAAGAYNNLYTLQPGDCVILQVNNGNDYIFGLTPTICTSTIACIFNQSSYCPSPTGTQTVTVTVTET